jgi:hypothetical protein
MRMRGFGTAAVVATVLAGTPARAQVLEVNATTQTLGGVHSYDEVRVINGGHIVVPPFNGTDRVNTGNLVLRARTIVVDETSSIVATGSGYQTVRCGNGGGPAADTGGRGGCALMDSGGGGGHFGAGGRGTKDCFVYGSATVCEFPQEWEEDCGNSLNAGGTACTTVTNCRNNDGVPTVAGQPFRHSIYDVEFGAAGGDKGCRDGDGFGAQPLVAGPGGGRIVLAGLSDAGDGTVDIRGQLRADGGPGCGTGNDSAGGGAGGSLLIIGDHVTVGPNALISAAGGLGGDTRGLAGGRADCPAPAQQGGTCDDCGGGGGGGLVAVLSRTSSLAQTARFDVRGALGGVCTICSGEAGGGAGELQLDGAFVGELCDGYDNDFDGATDEDLPPLSCGLPSCVAGVPQQCPTDPSCIGPVTDTRPRFLVVVDSSGSMLTDLSGEYTFGDGSLGHVGIDADSDGTEGNDSRLYQAKEALTRFVSAYTEIDFALARYHQDVGLDRSCQLAHWFECQDMCCSYDDPRDNTPPPAVPACTLDGGASGPVAVNMTSPADEQCINYAGSCGPPRRGADILVGFGRPLHQLLRWLDHAETAFVADTTEGDHCDFAGGGDCELRGAGPTPLAGSLDAVHDYLGPVVDCDGANACRTYGVILLTDGAESCRGDPVAAAQALWDDLGIRTFVVGFSVLAAEEARLNAIARAGSGGASDAYFAADESDLVNALAGIVAGSIISEACNGLDDDCDTLIDEDFTDLGLPCDDGGFGRCRGTGTRVCNGLGDDTACVITTPGATPLDEVCNGEDDDCDGRIDEGLSCIPPCVPTGDDLCDGIDNDCDGATDEDDPLVGTPCGDSDTPPCRLGSNTCIGGGIVCVGAINPSDETCNGIDDNCDGLTDNEAPCPAGSLCLEGACRHECELGSEWPCPPGYECIEVPDGWYCVPGRCGGVVCDPDEVCVDDVCVDIGPGDAGDVVSDATEATGDTGEESDDGPGDSCDGFSCPPGQVCTVQPSGEPLCVDAGDVLPDVPGDGGDIDWVMATGAGGCTCRTTGGGSRSGGWLALLAFVLLLRPRRGRGGRP